MKIGNGWEIHHLTDRVVELRKPDAAYLAVTGRPGFVRVRAEPGMDRQRLVQQATDEAKRCDERVSEIASRRFLPKGHLRKLEQVQRDQARIFATPEDPEVIGVKRA